MLSMSAAYVGGKMKTACGVVKRMVVVACVGLMLIWLMVKMTVVAAVDIMTLVIEMFAEALVVVAVECKMVIDVAVNFVDVEK